MENLWTAFDILTKGLTIVESGFKVKELLDKKSWDSEDKVQLASELFYITVQSIDIGVDCRNASNPNSYKNLKYYTSSGAAIAHVEKTAIPILFKNENPGQKEKLIGVILYRTSDLAKVGTNIPSMKNCSEAIKKATKVLGFSLTCYSLLKRIKANGEEVEPNPQMQYLFLREASEQLRHWEQMEKIHPALYFDPVLSQCKCQISDNPIRFIVVPRSQEVDDIYYERAEIETLLASQNPQPPLGWPPGLDFIRNNIKVERRLQCLIDKRLETLAKKLNPIL